MRSRGLHEEWQSVCRLAELEIARGVTALVHGQAIALFRISADEVCALGNHDPFALLSRASKPGTIAKGIVGVRGDVPFVASPAHKHAFALRTGQCLDDPQVSVPAYDVQVVDGVVQVGHRKADAA